MDEKEKTLGLCGFSGNCVQCFTDEEQMRTSGRALEACGPRSTEEHSWNLVTGYVLLPPEGRGPLES